MPLYFDNLPDGMRDVLVSRQGGLFISGFDSRRRVCLVLYAPPFGERLLMLAELPYHDPGGHTPTVLTTHDRPRNQLYTLLYQQPDNLGVAQMALYRIDPASGTQTLLASASSPFWPPAALVARDDGSVLVPLRGLGPILAYDGCNATACAPARPLATAASNATGKAGMVEVHGLLYLIVGSDAVYGSGGHVAVELPDGSLAPLADLSADRHSGRPHNPAILARGGSSLYVVSHELADEYGFALGSIHAYARRAAGANSSACARAGGCWLPPATAVASLSNPHGVAVDEGSGTLYVVEQNSLRAYSYALFSGDVLSFCASGHYDCARAQNAGECECIPGYGGPCCDVDLRGSLLAWLVSAAHLADVGLWSALLPSLLAAAMLIRIAYRRRAARGGGGASSGARAGGTARGGAPRDPLREPLMRVGESEVSPDGRVHKALLLLPDSFGGEVMYPAKLPPSPPARIRRHFLMRGMSPRRPRHRPSAMHLPAPPTTTDRPIRMAGHARRPSSSLTRVQVWAGPTGAPPAASGGAFLGS